MSRAANPFNVRTVLLLVLFGFLAFLATLYLIGAGETNNGRNDGQAHAASAGLPGFKALVGVLESAGHEVRLSRSKGSLDDDALLVLTPPAFSDADEIDEIVRSRRYVGPTLIVLPKWSAMSVANVPGFEAKDGWVVLGGAMAPDWTQELDPPIEGTASLTELKTSIHYDGMGVQGRLPDPKEVQAIDGDGYMPLILDGARRTLVGYPEDGGYYPVVDEAAGIPAMDAEDRDTDKWVVMVVAEPDLINNYGLAERDRAILAHRIVDTAMEGEDLDIVFDLTLNGFGNTQNLLTLAFSPPFLAATLCLILALLVVGWRAFARFGPPVAEEPALAFGKEQLVANSAGLIERSRRWHLLGAPYAALVGKRIAQRLGLRRSDPETIDAALARRNADAPSFSASAQALRDARTPRDVLSNARALKSLERKLAP